MRRLGLRGVPGFIVRRLLLGIVVLILVSIVVFAATQSLLTWLTAGSSASV